MIALRYRPPRLPLIIKQSSACKVLHGKPRFDSKSFPHHVDHSEIAPRYRPLRLPLIIKRSYACEVLHGKPGFDSKSFPHHVDCSEVLTTCLPLIIKQSSAW
ncbi:hypothetical protein ACFE04_001402 [Oxalis oulophora]